MHEARHDLAPRALGYRMPAEWEPHEATWLAWPHNREDWPGKFNAIPWLYAEIVRLLAQRERVHLIVEDAAMQKRVTGMLRRAHAHLENVSFTRGLRIGSGPAIRDQSSFEIRRGRSRSPTGSSTPGPSTTTAISTTSSRPA